MIQVRNLVKKYNNHLALNNLSFDVEDNQIFGFLGPNGAGKSTTMNMITGYLAPTSGQVLINGHDIVEDPIEAKKCIGYLPEIPPLYMEMTPREYLKFVGESKKMHKADIPAEVDRVMAKTNITDVQNRLIKTLSKGYRQRVGMAQAIMGDPQIIIMDEPTVGLDPMQIIEFRQLIKELGEEHTVIVSSHILAEISEICQKIMIIAKGNLIAIDAPENLAQRLNGGKLVNLKLREADFMKVSEQIRAMEEVEALNVLETAGGLTSMEIHGKAGAESFLEKLSVFLMEAKCPIMAIEEKELSLEDIFIQMVEGREETC